MAAAASLVVVDEAAAVVSVVASVGWWSVCSLVGGVVARVVLAADTVSPVVASLPQEEDRTARRWPGR